MQLPQQARRVFMGSKGNVIAALVALAPLAALIGWRVASQNDHKTVRYKMTVEVETPQGVRSGHAVRELRYGGRSSFPFGESRPYVEMTGEAVFVELPAGPMFALLTSERGEVDYAKQIPARAELSEATGPVELWPRAPDVIGFRRTDPLPMLVTFRELGQPKSVERVDPADLERTLGPGYALRRITVQITDEPVTTRLGQRLKVFGVLPDRSLDNDFKSTTDPTLAQQLGYSDFNRSGG